MDVQVLTALDVINGVEALVIDMVDAVGAHVFVDVKHNTILEMGFLQNQFCFDVSHFLK